MSQETSETAKRAARRYTREMVIAFALYALVVVAGVYALKSLALPQWAVVCIALAPLAPALLMLRAYATYVNAIDEFQRRIQMEAIMVSAAIVGFGSFAYGFLEEWAGFPRFPLILVLPALIGIWGLAVCIIRMRY
jgi:cation transport ATPase